MLTRFFLLLAAISAGTFPLNAQSSAAVSQAFPSATSAPDGWFHSSWFGWCWNGDSPWIYHIDGGWFYYGGGVETDGLYLYEADFGQWFWTSEHYYRWIYTYGAEPKWLLHPREAVTAPAGMVHVVGGVFQMGERPTTVSSFHLAIYPTTLAEWQEVRTWAISQGYDLAGIGAGCAGNHPVSSVNWYDAVKWCNARSEREGLTPVYYTDEAHTQLYRTGVVDLSPAHVRWDANGYRLPTEAEHWFAQNGGVHSQGFLYPGSDDPLEVGWFSENSGGAPCNIQDGQGTWPVGQKIPNELGLYDMSGNVWEFSFDWYIQEMSTEPVLDPRGPDTGTVRAGRGGSWLGEAVTLRNDLRGWVPPAPRNVLNGFRVARTPDE